MKINQTVTALHNGTSRQASPAIKGSTPAPEAAATPAATIDAARQVASTGLLTASSADFDAARVTEIRESISAGRYQINPSKIADGLISTVRDLLNQNSR